MKTIILDIDEVLVSSVVLDAARSGSSGAKTFLRQRLLNRATKRGPVQAEDYECSASLRELAGLGIVDSLIVNPES